MQLLSLSFTAGGPIPVRYTCEGENVSPEFSWKYAPGETKSFVFIVQDPDAPKAGGFTHWVLYNAPAEKTHLHPGVPNDEEVPGTGIQGTNDSSKIGYTGPCPPSGMHHYYFRLFALDRELRLRPGATSDELSRAMEGHILARAELVGTYRKKAGKAA
jgi:Raf kinase inhibitor-like YbhB/YbcL family protein